ncbi:MAG: hypothetical protein HW389_3476 [Bacteroidetes bacterium]|nr:hypothetical protein [Bacteroidota bacterium]
MNAATFRRLVRDYGEAGIHIGRRVPLAGDDEHDCYTMNDGTGDRVLSENDFLRDAKCRGFYHIACRFYHLELTQNIMAQEAQLCRELGCTRGELLVALAGLAEKDAIALTKTPRGRRIGIASATGDILTDLEVRLFAILEGRKSH